MFRQLIPAFPAPFRTIQHRIVHLRHRLSRLSTYRYADVTDVVAVVKGPERNRVFTGAGDRQVQRVTLALAIRDPIIGKYLVPSAAIDADIGSFDAAGGVLDLKVYPDMVGADLGRR